MTTVEEILTPREPDPGVEAFVSQADVLTLIVGQILATLVTKLDLEIDEPTKRVFHPVYMRARQRIRDVATEGDA